MKENKNTLVFGEMDGEKLSSMTAQLMRIGKRLSGDMKEALYLVFLGKDFSNAVQNGYGYGADRVYMGVDPLLEHYMTEPYLQAMEQIVKELNPAIVLFGQNDTGLDLAPRLAFRIRTGVTLDCVDLKWIPENGLIEQVKPVFGGKAHARFCCADTVPQIASVREGAFDPAGYDESIKNEVLPFPLTLNPSGVRTRFVKKERDENLALALKLASARIVVSGGRGLKKKEGMDLIKATADLLGGAVAGSRPAVDYGWLPHSLQVGLTGRKVNPEVYIAVGISGALQHMAGCMKSKTILAINSDESAPIFKLSHIGAVGDYREVLEGFLQEIRNAK